MQEEKVRMEKQASIPERNSPTNAGAAASTSSTAGET